LFANAQQALELRESVALAFLALLQRLPPKQRAAVLLKDVVGWSAAEVADALELSLPSVNSALTRARETLAGKPAPCADPPPIVLREYIRTWEERDVDGLVALLRADVTLSMPPFATWFHGVDAVAAFLRGPVLAPRWTRGFRVEPIRANGQLALAFAPASGGARTSIQFVEMVDGRVSMILPFIETYAGANA
jgi:RNA polymerase sigma-70 factor (ECF subfamily)